MNVILYMTISVDGMIAKDDDDTSWISATEWQSFSAMVRSAGCLVVGRRTYNILTCQSEFSELKNVKLVAVSKNDFSVTNPDHLKASSPLEALELLKEFETVIVAGGGMLNTSFLKEKLIDELYIDVEPVILGRGIKLFNGEDFQQNLKLIETKQLSPDEIQLHYKIIK